MFELLGITPQALVSQLLIGLINGSFYALLSLGLAVIFGLLNVINFTHGAQYMLGAMVAWLGLTQIGGWIGVPGFQLNYFVALILAPLLVGLFSMVIEKTMLKRLYHLDHLYGLLLTFGLALVIEGMFRHWFGALGNSYPVPELLQGGYTQVCEFHYLQHREDGSAYGDELAMSWALADAAETAGLGLTMLPVLYAHAGFQQPLLRPDQRRFATDAKGVRALQHGLAASGRPLLTRPAN